MAHATFAEWMEPDAVDFDELHKNYGPLLGLVELLLGVVPNCDRYMEIWPVSFRTYNLMVPNFINLPQMLIGLGAPKDLIGLSLYASSRGSECPYCTAHCCSFAQRRGAAPQAMIGQATPQQDAVLKAAYALGEMPHSFTRDHVTALQRHLKPSDVNWVGMGIAMMGFLNKFMDALGVPLEDASVADSHAILTQSGMGLGKHFTDRLPATVRPPIDNWRLYAKIAALAPGALRFDAKWLAGIPKADDMAAAYLQERTGIHFALIDRVPLVRPRRALTAMLRENLDPTQTELGLPSKAMLALLFAEFANNPARRADAEALVARHCDPLSDQIRHTIAAMAQGPIAGTETELSNQRDKLQAAGLSEVDTSLLLIGHALSPSPASLTEQGLALATQQVSRAQIVETVTWLSIQQLMHRLDVFLNVSELD